MSRAKLRLRTRQICSNQTVVLHAQLTQMSGAKCHALVVSFCVAQRHATTMIFAKSEENSFLAQISKFALFSTLCAQVFGAKTMRQELKFITAVMKTRVTNTCVRSLIIHFGRVVEQTSDTQVSSTILATRKSFVLVASKN